MLMHLKSEENYLQVEKIFNDLRRESKPRIVTWKQITELPIAHWENTKLGGAGYAQALLKYANSEPWYPVGQKEFMQSIEDGITPLDLGFDARVRLESSKDNRFFHGSKCRFLIDEWKENGWYSYPQATVTKKGTLWFHPGAIRQYALAVGDMYEQKVIVWDCWDGKELFPNEPIISFPEFRNIFTVKRNQWVQTKGFDSSDPQNFGAKPSIEWHVDEDRPNYYLTARRYQEEIFNFKKAKLFGEMVDPNYKQYFAEGEHHACLEIHMKEGKKFGHSSTKYIFHIPFEDKEWECEEFFIRKTF
jgi:hypothetical protein